MDKIKAIISDAIAGYISIDKNEIYNMIEVPPNSEMGDYAFPCFKLAKKLKKAPNIIAEDIKNNVDFGDATYEVNIIGGYLNIYINKKYLIKKVIEEVFNNKENYGASDFGQGKNVVIDYSAPNIAKPFHIGHLRSTVIGGALYNIYKFCGYNVVGVNHLGDWGTQFGLLMAGYKRWGNDEKIKENPIKELVDIYVRINKLAKEDENVANEGRDWFKKLEQGDEEAKKLWGWFREESLLDFKRVYELLNSKFDSWNGEAFYNDKTSEVVETLNKKGILKDSEGAKIVDLEEYGMPPCLIIKSNGTTIYATRDLAALLYRLREYNFDKAIYVTSYEQILHFKQIFKVFEMMGYKEYSDNCTHVPFGMVHLTTGKMSTREGNVIYLEELLNEAISKVRDIIENKNPNLENKEEISKIIGSGAVIFNDLKNNRIKDIAFDINDMVKFEGETGPYVQYVYVRTQSILNKAGYEKYNLEEINWELLLDKESINVVKLINKFSEIVVNSMNQNEPSIITRYVIDLAQAFSTLYNAKQMIDENNEQREANLALVYSTGRVIKTAMDLLGIKCPNKM